MNVETVLRVAADYDFVREEPYGSNAGRWVEAMQRVANGEKSDPWCAAYVSFVLGVAYKGRSPLPYTESCDEMLRAGIRWEWISDRPQVGDVFLVMRNPTDAIHTGFVTSVGGNFFGTIEGNASNPDQPATREGWGVFRRKREWKPEKYKFIRYQPR